MNENWLNENLCSFDEKVRVEIGPQIIEMPCNDDNLRNEVTHPNYRKGGRDALGRIIKYNELTDDERDQVDASMGVVNDGETMACVDWREKHAPKLWKVYKWVDSGEKDKQGKPVFRWTKINEFVDKAEALEFAKATAEGMQ